MSNFEQVYTETFDGFNIALSVTPEDISPRDCFEEDDIEEIIDKIERGDLLWFVAKVTASKHGVELAEDYLGGCCYTSTRDFIDGDYFYDMKLDAVYHAKEKLSLLRG